MRSINLNKKLNTVVLTLAVLLLGASVAAAQQQINLTAAPSSLTLPDGSTVPMWGYNCGVAVTGSTATCAALNPNAGAGWSPVVITVPTGQGLTINLTNNLYFMPATPLGANANAIPTSIMIVGQVGGGLGKTATYTASPDHSNAQANTTWPIANTGATALPPPQGPRVQSFSTEVGAVERGSGTPTALTWNNLRPGTYLLESGTHPSIQVPMGLYGILVVTTAPVAGTAGTAYPGVSYNSEIPLEFSEIDPVQNNSVNTAVNTANFIETATVGTYGYGPITNIDILKGGSGYTSAPTVSITGGGGSGAAATATVDTTSGSPTFGQITGFTITQGGTGYSSAPTITLAGGGGGTGAQVQAVLQNGADSLQHCAQGLQSAAGACYPPAVNYTPLYYLINGVAFNKTNASASLFSASAVTGVASGSTGSVLVRLVNAGLRMHVPEIVGAQTNSALTTQNQAAAGVPAVQNGFLLIAEDGNPSPITTRVQSDVFMAAGKTFDVMVNVPPSGATALPIYDRELSLSGNAINRDSGMLAYISVNGAGLPAATGAFAAAVARADTYNSLVGGQTLSVSDPAKGLIANDTNVFGVAVSATVCSGAPPTTPTASCSPAGGTLTLASNGTFSYVPNSGTTSDWFAYQANGNGPFAVVTLGKAVIESASGIVVNNISFNANTAQYVSIKPPGVLSVDQDKAGYPLSVVLSSVTPATGLTVVMDPTGGFNASLASPCATATGCSANFTYQAQNSQGVTSTATATVTINFPPTSNLQVQVIDGSTHQPLTGQDYRWVIEEDKTFYVNPNCTATANSQPTTGCPTFGTGGEFLPATFGVNFHTSHMEYIAQGCTGQLSCENGQTLLGVNAACDVGNGNCRTDANQLTEVLPSAVFLDPGCGFQTSPCTTGTAPYPKRYYISVLPGDAANPFNTGNASGGHSMGGAPITWNSSTNSWNPVNVIVEPTPFPTGRLSVMVFEDDFPLNGEQDAGGGIDVLATNEPGLGGFNIVLWDDMGQSGDVTGQMTYDMFNMPLGNSLDGTIDPATGLNACPISKQASGITGMIVTCPKYESDGVTLSPLVGQAVVSNLMPGRFSVQAYPAADRIARGEEWLQTNTLDGQHPHDSFIRIGEPAYFQEYGPAGYHVSIGFANPKIINARHDDVCNGTDLNLTASNCTNTVTGNVTTERMSRIPDERLYSSGSRDAFYWTQCYVSLGDPDGEDFMFTKCDSTGNFTFTNVPSGSWRLSIFDQWNDQLMDGLSTPVNVANGNNQTVHMGDVPVQQWQADVYTRTFIDDNKDGVFQGSELGIPLLNTTVRYRDGSLANNLLTDFGGVANFNETFPLFSWYVVETDTTRYKTTGIHTVYDAGGPADGTTCGGNYPPCGPPGTPYANMANTIDPYPLPNNLSVPGAIYCTAATCKGNSISTGTPVPSSSTASTGRIDPPWVAAEGWQGFSGQSNFIEFGKTPYATGENGGIRGHVVYASTRPFDDPQILVQTQWEPLVPHVTMNLYQEGFAADGITPTLTLVDTTQTSSWDDWAQGFRSDGVPYMNCPGQGTASGGGNPDLFFYTLYNQPNYLDLYNSYFNGTTLHSLPNNSEFKCYDGMHNWNQLQPAPYDGMYSFPSVLGIVPNGRNAGKLDTSLTGGVGSGSAFVKAPMAGTNCTICIPNPDSSDPWRAGTPMLPAGKYVVEIVLPAGYELVKEEDKNILIGDNFIAPVTQQFAGLGEIFILPDQASVATAGLPGNGYNAYNAQNPTQSLGTSPSSSGNWIVPGFLEPVWPCVGEPHVVPDFISLFPQSQEVAPFAGATRRLCDRKEVTLGTQMGATAKFYIFTSTHIASKFTGGITDDFTSEFDPFAPVFGEKFAPPSMPVSVKDWTGQEISRVYSDQWGQFDGLTYSTWEVNPPNPTGYSPTMMVQCMNDKGPIPGPNGTMIDDPLYNPAYSQFCYELPYMPGTTSYLDTPVVPTTAFVGAGYNNPDCNYPTLTPAVASVTGDVAGPWVMMPFSAGTVNAVNVTSGGSGYGAAPAVTFTGGGGTGATGTAVISREVTSVTINVGGHGAGYTSAPTVNFTGGGGSGAAATAGLGYGVSSIGISAAGSGYTARPTATIAPAPAGGINASANNGNTTGTFLSVSGFVFTSGSGYTSAPTVTIAAPGGACTPVGVRATATASIDTTAHVVTGITVTNPGSCYTARPTVTISGGGGTGASASALLSLNKVVLSNPGAGYTAAPSVTISAAPTGGTTATATSTLSTVGGVYSVTITNGGSGYTFAPNVSFTGGGGFGAAATAHVTGVVTAVNVTNGGAGYTTAPTVTFSGGGGSGAAATATLGSSTGGLLTITALGDKAVPNYGYSGPASSTAPFNQKTVTRHYGFGGAQGTVTIGGVSAPVQSWSDTQITVGVPAGVPNCPMQQQKQYGGLAQPAQCGELLITAANGQQSIDTVTVTIGGKKPTVLAAGQTIQSAIDAAAPGDMIIVTPGTYRELLLMWKPVRLQGVGGASSIIDANAHPAGKLNPWRASVNCLFGLSLNGQPSTGTSGTNAFDPSGQYSCPAPSSPTATGTGPDGNTWNYFYGGPNFPTMVVDRIPLEGILGWDATVNGNLAEQLQEPSIMGAYEGAGITVVAKGVNIPAGSADVFGSGAEAAFPTGSTLLTGLVGPNGGALTGDLNPLCGPNGTNQYPSNFMCNPSSIDGLGITDSSQGGGGVFVHAWAHNLQIANNRIFNNAGTLSGGMSIGQGESPEAYLNGTANDTDPGSCFTPLAGQSTTPLFPINTELPFCENINVNVHNNAITGNSSTGDELFTGTPAGAGGVSICTGSDFYNFNYNWVCGNLSTGDGGGLGHIGFSWNGDIEHNSILFNQATNPSIQSNGGGILIMGAGPDGTTTGGVECGSVTDNDCAPGLGDGTGPGLKINANLIQGNAADAGSGGGLRFQAVNGTDIARNPNPLQGLGFVSPTCATQSNALGLLTCQWYVVSVTNNIVVNNVAGWDGGGVSLEDALAVNLTNNTIVSNDTTASSGVLFNTLGAPNASSQSPAPKCVTQTGGTASCPQPAGLVSMGNSPQLTSSFTTGTVVCPPGYYAPGTGAANGSCIHISYPALYNNILWQNRSFDITVGPLGTGTQNQQNVVTMYNANFPPATSGTVAASQTATGACPVGSSYWDIGVRNDSGPANHGSGFTLNPLFGVLTSTSGYSSTNSSIDPMLSSQYCNGSRVPPENGGLGYQVPPGVADAVVPNPVFSLTPTATVDEGNNWINVSWGPLSILNPVSSNASINVLLGNYSLQSTSPAINAVPCSSTSGGVCTVPLPAGSSGVQSIKAPATDFFGHPRPDTTTGCSTAGSKGACIDIGAVEVSGH